MEERDGGWGVGGREGGEWEGGVGKRKRKRGWKREEGRLCVEGRQ